MDYRRARLEEHAAMMEEREARRNAPRAPGPGGARKPARRNVYDFSRPYSEIKRRRRAPPPVRYELPRSDGEEEEAISGDEDRVSETTSCTESVLDSEDEATSESEDDDDAPPKKRTLKKRRPAKLKGPGKPIAPPEWMRDPAQRATYAATHSSKAYAGGLQCHGPTCGLCWHPASYFSAAQRKRDQPWCQEYAACNDFGAGMREATDGKSFCRRCRLSLPTTSFDPDSNVCRVCRENE